MTDARDPARWWLGGRDPRAYARLTKGEFYATGADLSDPALSDNARKGRADFEAKYANAAVYGKVNVVNWGAKATLPADKFDFVLAARVFHGWMNGNSQDANLAKIYASPQAGRNPRHRTASR